MLTQTRISLPPGWIQQWDQNSQRNFYVEQATGRTQWDPPAFSPPPGQYGAPGYGAPAYGAPGYSQDANRGHGDSSYGLGVPGAPIGKQGEKKKEKSNTGKLVAAGAVGAIGGGILASQLGE